MRQAGIITDEKDARRFAAWLLTQRIESHTEKDSAGWAVWIRDEDHLAKAREALVHFQANPQDPKYRDAEGTADAIRQEEEQRRKKARENVVEMRSRWGTGLAGMSKRCPLVLALIASCILVTLLSHGGESSGGIVDWLLFCDPRAIAEGGDLNIWNSIRQGQVWRLVTPIFVHYGITHLIFNMLWMLEIGGQIETRRGSRYMLMLVLALAVLSNLGQAIEASLNELQGFRFGGMSGVGYGVFGYVLVKARFDNRERYRLSQATVIIGLIWFVLCILRDYPPFDTSLGSWIPRIANTAHTVGFFAGMAIAYGPLLLPRGEEK